jgi:hypothetical protein
LAVIAAWELVVILLLVEDVEEDLVVKVGVGVGAHGVGALQMRRRAGG